MKRCHRLPLLPQITCLALASFQPLRADSLVALSDEFDDPATLSAWKLHHEVEGWPSQIHALDIGGGAPGHLTIEPEVSGWYGDYRGVFLFKEIRGDFQATARVTSTALSGGVPAADFSLAGLMARAPRDLSPTTWAAGQENWVFINTGAQGRQPRIETKTTRQSVSSLFLYPIRSGAVELRMERAGATFTLSRRLDGEAWQVVDVFTRPDLPATLQVGLDAYTDWDTLWAGFAGNPLGFNSTVIQSPPGNRDLRARIDFIRFATPCSGPGCGAAPFRRGDANADGFFDLGDPLRTLFALFVAGRALECDKSGDANADGVLGVADAIAGLRALFLQSGPLPEPFATCGTEDAPSALSCESFAGCS